MTQQPNQRTEQIPVEACRFNAADFKPGTAGDGKTVPFTALARTAKPISHWYWGERCLHDFSGMDSAKSLPVDWSHDDREALGAITGQRIEKDGLHLDGFLAPMPDVPGDIATKVVFKSALGVPYQASIFWDPFSTVVEEVPEGYSTEVNGETWQGPLTVFRQWTLLGLAVCLYGVDGGTSVEFSKLSGQKAAVTFFSKGSKPMADPAVTPAAPATPATDAGTPPATPPATTPPAAAAPAAPATPAAPETPPATPPTQLSRAEAAKPFLTSFGPTHGPTLFAKHDKFEDAQAEYLTILRTENEDLKKKNAEFSKGPQGEQPATFAGGPATKTGRNTSFSKITSKMKIPGREKTAAS